MARNHYVPHFQTINYYYTNLPTKKFRYMLMFSFELNSIWVQRYKQKKRFRQGKRFMVMRKFVKRANCLFFLYK